MKATLTYHSIDDSGSPISLPPDVFASHVAWLTSGAVRVLSLDDLVTHPDDGADAVAITFDDGILNTRPAIETLIASGLPVTLFVVTSRVGATNQWGASLPPGIPLLPLLNWRDLEHLASRGAAVAAHTRTHRPLTTLSITELEDELAGCRADLAARLGITTSHVAYPFGNVNNEVTSQAGRSFRWGHTADFGVAHSSDRPLLLRRLDMYYYRRQDDLDAWGRPSFARKVAWIRAKRAIRGRVTRPRW